MKIWVCVYTHDHGTDVWVKESEEAMNESILVEIKKEITATGGYGAVRKLIGSGADADDVISAYNNYSEGENFRIESFNVHGSPHDHVRSAQWRRKAVRALRIARQRYAQWALAHERKVIDDVLAEVVSIDAALEET